MLDPEFTQQLQSYLAQPSDERDVRQGALLLLRINSNRYLYACACAAPARYADTIAYELTKHLRIRLDGLTRQDVALMEREALPRIEQTMAGGARPSSAPMPTTPRATTAAAAPTTTSCPTTSRSCTTTTASFTSR